tara:strand:+ start:459 stop:1085 length:627 start_codon:yes stop_codon:yes gene_type:complete
MDKVKTLSERAQTDEVMNRSYEDPFYIFSLNDDAIGRLNRYLTTIPDSEEYWIPEKSGYSDPTRGIDPRDDYRICDVHCPKSGSDVEVIGQSLFNLVNSKHYEFDINTFEFQILRYRAGGQFDWHCDYGVAPNKNVWRKLSMSVQLSDPSDYKGGELIIVDYFNKHCQIPNPQGACIVFDARCPHRAQPVTEGIRYVLVGWASGPKLR